MKLVFSRNHNSYSFFSHSLLKGQNPNFPIFSAHFIAYFNRVRGKNWILIIIFTVYCFVSTVTGNRNKKKYVFLLWKTFASPIFCFLSIWANTVRYKHKQFYNIITVNIDSLAFTMRNEWTENKGCSKLIFSFIYWIFTIIQKLTWQNHSLHIMY